MHSGNIHDTLFQISQPNLQSIVHDDYVRFFGTQPTSSADIQALLEENLLVFNTMQRVLERTNQIAPLSQLANFEVNLVTFIKNFASQHQNLCQGEKFANLIITYLKFYYSRYPDNNLSGEVNSLLNFIATANFLTASRDLLLVTLDNIEDFTADRIAYLKNCLSTAAISANETVTTIAEAPTGAIWRARFYSGELTTAISLLISDVSSISTKVHLILLDIFEFNDIDSPTSNPSKPSSLIQWFRIKHIIDRLIEYLEANTNNPSVHLTMAFFSSSFMLHIENVQQAIDNLPDDSYADPTDLLKFEILDNAKSYLTAKNEQLLQLGINLGIITPNLASPSP